MTLSNDSPYCLDDYLVIPEVSWHGRGQVVVSPEDVCQRRVDRLRGEGQGVPRLLQGVLNSQDLRVTQPGQLGHGTPKLVEQGVALLK